MPEYDARLFELKAELCKTFADPKRLMIISALGSGERTVGDLAETIDVPQATTSRHLAILRERGAVNTRRDGTSIYYSLADARISQACGLVHQILMAQMERNRDFAERVIP